MWRPSGATKRQKELARQEYQREKLAKREQRRNEKKKRAEGDEIGQAPADAGPVASPDAAATPEQVKSAEG